MLSYNYENCDSDSSLTCKNCKRKFKSKNGLKYHMKKNVCKKDNDESMKCEICNKTYLHKSSYYRHKSSGVCKKRQMDLVLYNDRKEDDFFREFEQFSNINSEKYKNKKGKKRINKTSVNNGQINIIGNNNKIMYTNVVNNNNIHIKNVIVNNFGKENTSYITSKVIKEIINRYAPENVIPKVIEYKNFNQTHPENHNIRMTNIKEKRIEAMIGNEMRAVDRDQLYQYSINKADKFIKSKLNEINQNELKLNQQISIKQYKKFFNKLIKDIELYKSGSYKRKNEYMKQKKLLDNIIITFRELEKRLQKEQMELEELEIDEDEYQDEENEEDEYQHEDNEEGIEEINLIKNKNNNNIIMNI